jgi:hypothetical protein
LERLEAGQPVVYGGDRIARVSEDLAREFAPGDRLVVVQDTGALLRIPAADHALADAAVTAAHQAFLELGRLPDAAVTAFFEGFARRLEDPAVFARIAAANADDVAAPGTRSRHGTAGARTGCVRTWWPACGPRDMPSERDQLIDVVEHPGWRVERRRPSRVIGFGSRVARTSSPMPRACCGAATPSSSASARRARHRHRHPRAGAHARARRSGGCPGAAGSSSIAGDRLRDVLPPASGLAVARSGPASPSSVPSPARPACRSASTGPAARGSSPASEPMPIASRPQ